MTAGGMLLDAAARHGCYGVQTRSVGPQIRGGEAAALLRLADRPVESHGDGFDVLLALDWQNYGRFAAEIPLAAQSVVIADPQSGPVPDSVAAAGCRIVEMPLKRMADAVEGGRVNMVALGVVAQAVGVPCGIVADLVAETLASKGAAAVAASTACVAAGRGLAADLGDVARLACADAAARPPRWLMTGNEAAALGALRGGIRFAAGYPITPATEILEWLAPALARVGGTLVQAEDELASINMIIGASYGGVPALTATSGPGLALMTEALGLATAAEVPVVVIDVMRGGPSTGIPTKSEQSDLNIAVYGLHGDAPHLVVAPVSLADCLFATQWAVHLADAVQAPAIVLSDQFLGQARMIVDRPANVSFIAERKLASRCDTAYARYAPTADGISPMALPGTACGQYTADGLAHGATGLPSSAAEDHLRQLAKRRDKIDNFPYGSHWAEIEGEGDLVVLTWGSTSAAVREAAGRARLQGVEVKTIAVRLIAPLDVDALDAELGAARRVLVVEQTDSAQFHRYLRSLCDLPRNTRSIRHAGPLPMRPGEIHREIMSEARP